MIHVQKQRMEEFNKDICVYQNYMKKGKINLKKEFVKLYKKNWSVLFNVHRVYKMICKKNSRTIVAIFNECAEKYIKDLKKKNQITSENEELTREYLNVMEFVCKDNVPNQFLWREVEHEIRNRLCYCASLYEITMR